MRILGLDAAKEKLEIVSGAAPPPFRIFTGGFFLRNAFRLIQEYCTKLNNPKNTKFILHGGYAGRPNSKNDNFFREILKDVPRDAKILLVYFAKEENEYSRMEAEDLSQFEKNKDEHDLSFEIAASEIFPKQIVQSDIIYLHGGNTSRLLEKLKEYPPFGKLVSGKIVAGESAGAYVLSSCFYSKTEGGVSKGLGLVPVKTICHYVGQNKEKLDRCPAGLETLLLADYQYRVFKFSLPA